MNLIKFDSAKDEIDRLIASKSLPTHIKTPEQLYFIAQKGKELGFPIMQAIDFLIPIQGRITLSAKAIGALLRKGGVRFTCTEDAVWIYPDGTIKEVHSGEVKPVDRRTTIKFTRGEDVEIVSFYWSDAIAQGLVTKDNWKRMPKEMLYARTLSKGANRIGQDFLLGMYMTDEIVDALGVEDGRKVVRDEDGFITNVVEDVAYTEAK